MDGTPPSGALASRWLAEHELVAVLPPGTTHRLFTVTVSELVPLGLISTPRGTAMRTLLDEQLEAAGAAPEVAIETAHVASVIPLVLVGAGVAILPEGMAAEAAAKGARVVRLDPPTRTCVSPGMATGPAQRDSGALSHAGRRSRRQSRCIAVVYSCHSKPVSLFRGVSLVQRVTYVYCDTHI